MPKHKGEDYKLIAVQYYLENMETQIDTCNIFKCSPRSLMRWTMILMLYKVYNCSNTKSLVSFVLIL